MRREKGEREGGRTHTIQIMVSFHLEFGVPKGTSREREEFGELRLS